jgi:uncharacterized protein YigE (DUF2233 family)
MPPSLWLRVCLLWLVGTSAFAVEFSTADFEGKRITVAKVDVHRERLQLFLNDNEGRPLKSFENLLKMLQPTGQRLVFATNAGMYHADYSPVGLFVAEGKQVAPLNLEDDEGNFFLKPNGVFLVTDKGARVLESSELLKLEGETIRLATQSGPLLLRNNRIHPAFKPTSEFRLIRNGVGVAEPGVALFAQSEDVVNLHEFARFFRDALRCPDALYFDGTVSSLHAPELSRSEKKIDLGPIIGVIEEPASR